MSDKKELNFEEAMEKLEKISTELEDGKLTLDESVEKFEEGMKLSKACNDILEKAEKKITMLVRDGEDLKEVAVKITKSGVNVEKVITNKIDNLVVGQIKKVTKHPDSDHLNLCMVDTGNDVVQIVCGASNVKEGLKVIVALPGAVLPGNFEIKKGKIKSLSNN